jgi:hypothetical protein
MRKKAYKYHADGTRTRVVNSASAGNAVVKPHRRIHANVKHGAYSLRLLDGDFDYRTELGQSVKGFKGVLVQHLGGESNVSGPEWILIDQAARLQVLTRIAWAATHRDGNFRLDGTPSPALDTFLRVTRSLREVLGMLGLQRHEKQIMSLTEYIASKADEANTVDANEVVQE